MQDAPNPEQLLAAVAGFLRQDVGPTLGRTAHAGSDATGTPDHAALAYQCKVAANMLDIAARQQSLAGPAQAAELARLHALLGGVDTNLTEANQRLSDGLARGQLGLHTPDLAAHLWATTLDKLAVDQPRYARYQQVLQALAGQGSRGPD